MTRDTRQVYTAGSFQEVDGVGRSGEGGGSGKPLGRKGHRGFPERGSGVMGGRPAQHRGEAARVNCSQGGKGPGRWAEAFKQKLGSGKQPLTFRAGTD